MQSRQAKSCNGVWVTNIVFQASCIMYLYKLRSVVATLFSGMVMTTRFTLLVTRLDEIHICGKLSTTTGILPSCTMSVYLHIILSNWIVYDIFIICFKELNEFSSSLNEGKWIFNVNLVEYALFGWNVYS